MKNGLRFTVLLLIAGIGTVSFGQSLNLKGGFTTSTIKPLDFEEEPTIYFADEGAYTDSDEIKRVNGFHLALAYEFKLGNRLSLETGFKYQSRGYRWVSEYSFEHNNGTEYWSEKGDLSARYKYLDLPIVLNTAITTGDFRVYARTGIYAGLMIGGKTAVIYDFTSSEGDNGTYVYNNKLTVSDMDFEDRITAGFIVGLGAEYKGFYFETNYSMGPFRVGDLDLDVYTRDLSFSLGYKLKFNQ
ncbi:MAG: hypothetical protein ACI8ZM_005013 [Crocinitomix sp.]|jgi:hypothetical protein